MVMSCDYPSSTRYMVNQSAFYLKRVFDYIRLFPIGYQLLEFDTIDDGEYGNILNKRVLINRIMVFYRYECEYSRDIKASSLTHRHPGYLRTVETVHTNYLASRNLRYCMNGPIRYYRPSF